MFFFNVVPKWSISRVNRKLNFKNQGLNETGGSGRSFSWLKDLSGLCRKGVTSGSCHGYEPCAHSLKKLARARKDVRRN